MNAIGTLHTNLVFKRRTRVLAEALARAIPTTARTVLDVGCGDGTISRLIGARRPELFIAGVDVHARPRTHIPITLFDGERLPFLDGGFDVVMFVDVLHHTPDPAILLREAKRVARGTVVLKDHTRDSPLADATLRFMDWVGNAHHGVHLPYNYWSSAQWRKAFQTIGLSPETNETRLGLYPFPTSLVFERGLHFVSRLAV
jgi:SAM-dependent methyltransferase